MKRFRFFLMFLLFMGEFLYANLTQSEVSSLYVAIFNRASEGEGNRFWQGYKPTLEETANAMLNTQDAIEYFGDSLDSNQAFIEHIYKNTLNKTYSEDPEGIKYWTKRLDSGESRGKIVADMVYIIKQYSDTKDPLAKRAYKQFMNRVNVSNYTAKKIEYVPENYKQALGFDGDLKVTDNFKTAGEATVKIDILTGWKPTPSKPEALTPGGYKYEVVKIDNGDTEFTWKGSEGAVRYIVCYYKVDYDEDSVDNIYQNVECNYHVPASQTSINFNLNLIPGELYSWQVAACSDEKDNKTCIWSTLGMPLFELAQSDTDIKYNLSFDVEVQEGGKTFVKNISLTTENGNQKQDIESWEWTLYNNKTGKSIDSNTADSRQKEYITDLDAGEYKIVLKVKLSNGKEVENFKIFGVVSDSTTKPDSYKFGDNSNNNSNQNNQQTTSLLKKTGQTVSYTDYDDGYYQAGVTPSYTRDDSTGIVTDHVTGLMWQDNETVKKPWLTQENYNKCAGESDQTKDDSKCYDTSGDTATTYCSNLRLGGYNDWRLPTRNELVGIADYSRYNPAINPVFKHTTTSSFYWLLTTNARLHNFAQLISFEYGDSGKYRKVYSGFIRCVREDK